MSRLISAVIIGLAILYATSSAIEAYLKVHGWSECIPKKVAYTETMLCSPDEFLKEKRSEV